MEKEEKKCPRTSSVRDGKRKLIVVFRWFALASIVIFYFLSASRVKVSKYFFVFFTASLVYNIFITAYAYMSRRKGGFKPGLIIYIDIILISVLSAFLSMADSDAFILIFYILGYCGIYAKKSFTINAGILSVIFYTASSIYMAKSGDSAVNYLRLAMRDIYFMIAAFGITAINNEVKRYGEMHKKEFKLARTDRLTGLANRHYFEQKLVEESEYAIKSENPLNILIFDLDNFKRFNDTYGHIWGDKLLTLFSDIIVQNIRKIDIPVRYGGEEFLVLIRDLNIEQAKGVAERIRKQLEKQRIFVGEGESRSKVTVSCGVAQFPCHSRNIREVIDLADKALYWAKESGKNLVITYEEMGMKRNIAVEK